MKEEIRNGILGSLSLILFYFLIMIAATRSWSSTFEQFRQLWYWMVPLVLGFGIQIGLYTKLKNIAGHSSIAGKAKEVATASTGTSSASMVACCAHHLTEVLPIIGLSGFSVFLTRYQTPIIVFGIVMNLLGIIYMLKMIKKIESHVKN